MFDLHSNIWKWFTYAFILLWLSIILVIFKIYIPSETVPSDEWVISDEFVLQVYYSNIKTHSGFYSEEKGADNYLFKYNPENPYKSPVYCWNNIEEAKAISYPRILSWSQFYEKIYKEVWTEKYFQFETKNKKSGQDVIFRIDNCNYVKRDSRSWTWNIGIFQKSPLNIESIKELSEYLWFEGKYTFWGVWTINSSIHEDSENFYSIIYYVSWVGWDWWLSDKISLIKRITIVNKKNWLITLDETVVKEVTWKYNSQN